MYESYFELRQRPFAAAARADRFFPAKTVESARTTLTRIIQRAEGAGVIIGSSGTGKTLLCQILAEQFRASFASVLLSSGRLCTRRALLQAILFELQLPYKGLEEGELRLSLIDYLSSGPQDQQGMLLLVDEAHSLSWRLLDELRMITNLVRDGQPRVRIVLAGGPQLEERFASPKLDSFSQRLAARCYLGTMDRDETAGFVQYQIKTAGGDPKRVFAAEAYASIYQATDGVPRLVNQVCDHALILAGLAGCRPVSSAVINEAWSDLQQLPTPYQSAASDDAEGVSQVVEFAMLDDDDDVPEAIPFPQPRARVESFDASEQLQRIERQLSELEDDFEPAGSIMPEIDLTFASLANPFQEPFEEEEVVIDRYASLGADLFTERTAVASREGEELGQLLAGFAAQAAQPEPAAAPQFGATPAVVGPVGEPAFETRSVVTMADANHSLPMLRAEQLVTDIKRAISEDDELDHDLIVLDDDQPQVPVVPPAGLVRRQEYRQLFASLRRG